MRKDQYLKEQEAKNLNLIPVRIRYELANQWKAAGLNPNHYLDDKGNWYVSTASTYLEAEKSNKAMSDMCEFWRKKLNWGINKKKHRWYNKSEAMGFLFDQYLRCCVKQDKLVEGNRLFMTKTGKTIKNARIYSGWKEETIKEKKPLFLKALASTILDMVQSSELSILTNDFGPNRTQDFAGWFDLQCEICKEPKFKGEPQPYVVFGNEESTSKHYKVTESEDDPGLFICDQEVKQSEREKRKKKEERERRWEDIKYYILLYSTVALLEGLLFWLYCLIS